MRMVETFRGSGEVLVFAGRAGREPHFVIRGAAPGDLDGALVREYLEGVDWRDRGSPGWITPSVRCDDFLTERAKRRATHGYDD